MEERKKIGRPLGSKNKEGHKAGKNFWNNPAVVKKRVELTESKETISRIVNESYQYFGRKPALNNQEIADRLNAYFKQCVTEGQIPTVEDMALSLGVTRVTLHDWEYKVQTNPERAEMIRMAKEILAGIDAKLVSEGKIPQVTYIFRAKNYFGLRDQQEVVLTPNTDPLGENVDTEKLKQKYLENTYGVKDEVKMIEGEFEVVKKDS